jgi:hypothetical protein
VGRTSVEIPFGVSEVDDQIDALRDILIEKAAEVVLSDAKKKEHF